MNSNRKTAITVGVLFIIATGAYMLGEILIGSILNAPDYLSNVSANENQVKIGALFVLIDCVAVVGIGVMMFPILRKHNEPIALGYVGFRIVECAIFIVSVIGTLSLLPLSQEFVKAGAPDASYFQALGTSLLAVREWAIFVGLRIAFSLGALMFYYLLYQSKLIPRFLSVWGLIGATLILAAGLLDMFGLSPSSTITTFLDLPIWVQEMVLAVWLIVKGFNSSAIASGSAKTDTNKV